jgi:hypothetical protein
MLLGHWHYYWASQELEAWSAKTTGELQRKMHATLNASLPLLTKTVVDAIKAKATVDAAKHAAATGEAAA